MHSYVCYKSKCPLENRYEEILCCRLLHFKWSPKPHPPVYMRQTSKFGNGILWATWKSMSAKMPGWVNDFSSWPTDYMYNYGQPKNVFCNPWLLIIFFSDPDSTSFWLLPVPRLVQLVPSWANHGTGKSQELVLSGLLGDLVLKKASTS